MHEVHTVGQVVRVPMVGKFNFRVYLTWFSP